MYRTGVSRPGIGNRVVERINRPLQEFLLAADDDSDLLDSSSELDLKLLSDLEEADEADVLVQFSLSTLSGVDTASLNKSAASRTSPGPVGEVAAGRQGRAVQKSGGSHATTARAEQNNVISTDMVDHCQVWSINSQYTIFVIQILMYEARSAHRSDSLAFCLKYVLLYLVIAFGTLYETFSHKCLHTFKFFSSLRS